MHLVMHPHQVARVCKQMVCITALSLVLVSAVIGDVELKLVSGVMVGAPYRIALARGCAFIAGGLLAIVDISNPSHLRQVSYAEAGDAKDVVLAKNFAFVANGNAGIRIYDVSDTRLPRSIAQFKTRDVAECIRIYDSVALVADGYAGVCVVDVSNVTAPTKITSISSEGRCEAIALDGGIAYVADGGGGIFAIDITAPKKPRLLWRWRSQEPTWVEDLQVVRGQLLAACGDAGLLIFKLQGKHPPNLLHSVKIEGWVERICIHRDFAFVISTGGEWRGITVVKLNASKPRIVAKCDLPISDIAFDEEQNIAIAVSQTHGVLVCQIAHNGALQVLSELPAVGLVNALAYAHSKLFVANGDGGLLVFDVTNPRSLRKVMRIPLPGSANSLVANGNQLFVACGVGGIHAFALNGDLLEHIGACHLSAPAKRIHKAGRFLYVQAGYGFSVVDASNPRNMREVHYERTYPGSGGVAVDDDFAFAYVANGGMGFRIFALRDGVPVRQLAHLEKPRVGWGIVARKCNDYVLMGEWTGLVAINVHNPRMPTVAGKFTMGSQVVDLHLLGNNIVCAVCTRYPKPEASGLWLIDISDLPHMRLVARYKGIGEGRAVCSADNIIFFGDRNAGIVALQVDVKRQ